MKKQIVVMILLAVTMAAAFGLPKPKYTSPNIIPQLEIPLVFEGWRGKDVSDELNLGDDRYKFVSKIFSGSYVNRYRENLMFLVLDAGNFHHPKVCFGSSGFEVKDLPDVEFDVDGRKIKAKALYTRKGDEGYLLIYWIAINKDIVDWTGQKFLQLWYSMFNKQKIGLMVRFDIPTSEDRIDSSIKLAKEFLAGVAPRIPAGYRGYMFGGK